MFREGVPLKENGSLESPVAHSLKPSPGRVQTMQLAWPRSGRGNWGEEFSVNVDGSDALLFTRPYEDLGRATLNILEALRPFARDPNESVTVV